MQGNPARPRQPTGLWVIATTEMLERISFHSTQALLTLYLAGELLMPGHLAGVTGLGPLKTALLRLMGHLSIDGLAAQIFGLYIGLIYLAPLIGGAIGDRLTGRRVAIVLGAFLMVLGHVALAFDRSFLLGLLLLVAGTGLLRGNLSAQLKALYADGDRQEADGFQIFYIALCIGAFVAPLISGLLVSLYGWHAALAFAGIGMIAALLVYLVGLKLLPEAQPSHRPAPQVRLTAVERRRMRGLFAVWPFIMVFWIAQTQVWNVYNLWVRDFVDLDISGFTVPVPWLQSLDGLAPALLSPCVIWWCRRQARSGREPDLLTKLAIGCFIFAGAMCLLCLAPLFENADGRTSLLLPILFHVISNLGTAFFAPTAITLFATEAPVSRRGVMIGANSLAVFCAGLISGRLGNFYGIWQPSLFWLVHAGMALAAGILLWLLKPAIVGLATRRA